MFSFDRLMSLAKAQKRSASYLCSLIPRANNYINDLRRQKREPSADIVAIWAAALHTTPAYLMGETDDPSAETKKEPTGLAADGLSDDKRFLIECAMTMSDENARKLRTIVEQVFLERGK